VGTTPPGAEALETMAQILRGGGVVVYPTETFYGLGAHCRHPGALERIYALKARPRDLPLLCLLDGLPRLGELVDRVPPWAEALTRAFWPGPLTLVLPARPGLHPALLGPAGGVAVRWTSHPLAQGLVSRVGAPVVGTSANPSGRPAPVRVTELEPSVARGVDGILDGGELPGQNPSTLVDCTAWPPRLLREGAVSRQRLESWVRLG
jgi:L-threonylcarbamoyladenylate synthase